MEGEKQRQKDEEQKELMRNVEGDLYQFESGSVDILVNILDA